MAKKIFVVLGLIWTVLVGTFFYMYSYGLGFRYDYSMMNDYASFGLERYIAEIVRNDSYVFHTDRAGKVQDIIPVSEFKEGAKVERIVYDGMLYVLISDTTEIEDNTVRIYDIVAYDSDLKPVYESGWILPDMDGRVVEFVPDSVGFRVTMLSGTGAHVFVYEIAETVSKKVLTDESGVVVTNEDNPVYYSLDRSFSNSDGTYNISAFFDTEAKGLYDSLKFEARHIMQLNQQVLIISVASLVVGIVFLFLMYLLMRFQNRVIYMVFLWEFMLFSVVATYESGIRNLMSRTGVLTGVISFFIIASALGIFVLVTESVDLSLLREAMEKVALGDVDINGVSGIKKPAVYGKDMVCMWNALLDVCRLVDNLNYKRQKTYETYSRFAPKRVSEMLGKKSLTDVAAMDYTDTEGILVIINFDISRVQRDFIDNRGQLAFISDFLKLATDCQDRNEGILIDTAVDMSSMIMLFPRDTDSCFRFVYNVTKTIRDSGSLSIIIHNTSFIYGVVGDEKQSLTYLVSDRLSRFQQDYELFKSISPKIVITGDMLDYAGQTIQKRFIGYFENDGQRLDLYELLDALSDKERRLKLETLSVFEEAMVLFTSKDYYLSRNRFADVIKVNPSDEIARWYLFACEAFLNDKCTYENSGFLRV